MKTIKIYKRNVTVRTGYRKYPYKKVTEYVVTYNNVTYNNVTYSNRLTELENPRLKNKI